jgi:hypothetical protein
MRFRLCQVLTLVAYVAMAGLLPLAGLAQAPLSATTGREPLPLKYVGPPTLPEITAGDLMTRVYKFADDSMMGRAVGTVHNDVATAYIERELRRIGIQPAGDNGGYFQKLPLVNRRFDSTSTITVGDSTFRAYEDFVAAGEGEGRSGEISGVPVIYLGAVWDTVDVVPVDSVRGRTAVVRVTSLPAGMDGQALAQSAGYQQFVASVEAARAVVLVGGARLSPGALRGAATPGTVVADEQGQLTIVATSRLGEAILGGPLTEIPRGRAGQPLASAVRFIDEDRPGRNVVGVLPGADRALRGQYVAIGAHSDHVNPVTTSVDHDSLRVFLKVVRPQGADSPPRDPSADEAVTMRAMLDSLRRSSAPRRDSIRNGADDDASGSMTVLEIAEAFARGPVKPRRSILFVWHTGEEAGLWGASYFTAHPTVPRDSIIAQLNMDMVGRGGAEDVTGESKDGALLRGGPGYVQLIGARRLSTELGDLLEQVNVEERLGLRFDYAMDANGHPQNIYCRSDHYEYAKYGIPIAFITTGGHADYHQVTDEPQYLDYAHMGAVGRLVFATALRLANLDHRVVVDQPKPDPKAACVQ